MYIEWFLFMLGQSLMLVANNRIEVEKVVFISWKLCKIEHEHLQCFLEKSRHCPNFALCRE